MILNLILNLYTADNKDVDQMTVDEICQKGNRIQQDDIQRLKGMTSKMDSMKEVFPFAVILLLFYFL